jgi:hypothetical protein
LLEPKESLAGTANAAEQANRKLRRLNMAGTLPHSAFGPAQLFRIRKL